MDFIVGLPRSRHGNDAIWVITDRLTKVAHFIPVKTTYTTQRLARLYLARIVCLHGVPETIISDRGTTRKTSTNGAPIMAINGASVVRH